MFSNEAFKFNNEGGENNKTEKNFDDELASLRKKQINCVSMPEKMEGEFYELKKKEAENNINPIELNRLRSIKEEYWTKEDQEKLLSLADKEDSESSSKESYDHERFLELSKKQTAGELNEEEKDEIKNLYQKI